MREPGAIKRLTVAVLVNGVESTDANGEVSIEPRPEEELEAFRELVASAVGFDETRGDKITLKSMSFQPVVAQGTAGNGSMFGALALDMMSLIQMAIVALVTLVLGIVCRTAVVVAPLSRATA